MHMGFSKLESCIYARGACDCLFVPAAPHSLLSRGPLVCIRTLAVKKEEATRRLLASFAPRTELNTNVASAADLVLQMKKVH
jgi:hypothetical protein